MRRPRSPGLESAVCSSVRRLPDASRERGQLATRARGPGLPGALKRRVSPNFRANVTSSSRHVSPSARAPLLEGLSSSSRPPQRIYSPPRRVQDLGKSSNDLLGRDFPISGVALEVKTATPSNVLFKVGGNRDTKSQFITGDVEAKFFNKPHGLVFTQTWTTSNILKTQVELDNQIAKGVKLELATALTPNTGAKSALFTTTYKQPGLHTRAFLDIFKVRPRASRLMT